MSEVNAMSQQQHGKRAFQAWFDKPEIERIDCWRRQQDVIPTIAEAMRELVKRGLAATASEAKASEVP